LILFVKKNNGILAKVTLFSAQFKIRPWQKNSFLLTGICPKPAFGNFASRAFAQSQLLAILSFGHLPKAPFFQIWLFGHSPKASFWRFCLSGICPKQHFFKFGSSGIRPKPAFGDFAFRALQNCEKTKCALLIA